jgi:hypothetical protein
VIGGPTDDGAGDDEHGGTRSPTDSAEEGPAMSTPTLSAPVRPTAASGLPADPVLVAALRARTRTPTWCSCAGTPR